MAIVMTEFTTNVSVNVDNTVTGNGIFDDMMEVVSTHIKAQYDEGRINGGDYATVYLGALQSVIGESVKILMNRDLITKQVESEAANKLLIESKIADGVSGRDLITKQVESEAANKLLIEDRVADGVAKRLLVAKQVESEVAKEKLVVRQTEGFNDDAKQKLLKQVLDSWSVGFSVSQTSIAIPDAIKVDSVDSILKSAMVGLGITMGTNPLGL